MAILVDADVIIRGEKGRFDLPGWLNDQREAAIGLAAITVAEIWHGVERATPEARERREKYLAELIAGAVIYPYTEATAYINARLWAALSAGGKSIGAHDLIVAATAMEHDCAIATFNRRHFAAVPGLTVIDPK